MAGEDFNRMHICAGTEVIKAPQASPRSIVFEKKMEGIPTITTMVVGSSQNVIAANVTSSGFDIILSLDGTGDMNETFTVHYQAIFLR